MILIKHKLVLDEDADDVVRMIFAKRIYPAVLDKKDRSYARWYIGDLLDFFDEMEKIKHE